MYNENQPNCYLTSDCYLICKGEDGSYMLPGTPLSGEACQQAAQMLAASGGYLNGNTQNGKSSTGGGLGLLPFDLPTFGMKIDWDKVINKLANILGVTPDDLKLIAKTLLIVGALIVTVVLFNALKK